MQLGYEIYADTTIILGHIGNYEYTVHDIPNFKKHQKTENVLFKLGKNTVPVLNGNEALIGSKE